MVINMKFLEWHMLKKYLFLLLSLGLNAVVLSGFKTGAKLM